MKSKRMIAITSFAFAALLLSSCSGSPDASETSEAPDSAENAENVESPETEASGELDEITLGLMEIASSTPVIYGIEEGIFEKHGLDVDYAISRGGGVMLPAVESGEYDFGIVNPLSVLNANDRGLEMTILTGFAFGPPEGDDSQGVVTRKDTGIDDFGDLAGREVAVNTLQTQGDLSIMEATDIQGGDPASINFLEIPFPDMTAQMELGNAEAIWLPEPLLAQALSNPDNKLLGSSAQIAQPGMPMFISFGAKSYIEENPDITDRFVAALEEVLAESVANEDEVRALMSDFTGLPPQLTENMIIEEWDPELRKDLIDGVGEMAVKHGFINNVPDNLYRD